MKKWLMLMLIFTLVLFFSPVHAYAGNQAGTTEEQDSLNNPVADVNINTGGNAPSMHHTALDDNPASTFRTTIAVFFTQYKIVVLGIAGMVDLLLIGVVIFRIMAFGAAAGSSNAKDRKDAMTSLFISLIAVAIAGSATLWYGLFFNAFR